jgi:hypothetical protein
VFNETVILGPVIHQRDYSPEEGGRSSGQLIQAVLRLPDGVGVAVWDTDHYDALKDVPDGLAFEVWNCFVSFERCEPGIKALLLPHIEPLVEELFRRLPRN